jgi:hypothetical protein
LKESRYIAVSQLIFSFGAAAGAGKHENRTNKEGKGEGEMATPHEGRRRTHQKLASPASPQVIREVDELQE